MSAVWRWIDERFELSRTVWPVLQHPIPGELRGRIGWAYVLGSSILVALGIQVLTGLALAMSYVPSTANAYDSLRFITNDVPFGALLRGIHFFGASAMVVLVVAHMCRVFLMGAYKFPREANWLSGSLLFAATLVMAFTGQTLRWDQDAFWSVVVGAEQAARVPLIGDALTRLFIAGDRVSGATLTRFYATHIFLVPALIAAIVSAHVFLVLRRGVTAPPRKDERVDPAIEMERYERRLRVNAVPYWPEEAWRDAVAGLLLFAIVAALAMTVGAPQLGKPPDPSIIVADPRPDWYFIGYFSVLALLPARAEPLLIVVIPILVFAALFLLPFVRPASYRHPLRRPLAVLTVFVLVAGYGGLMAVGAMSPWVPLRIEGVALPAPVTSGLSGPAREGAGLFVSKSCVSCHTVAGVGGTRGPDLTDVGARLDPAFMTARIANGGPGMPGYARSLTRDELDALVAFLRTRTR